VGAAGLSIGTSKGFQRFQCNPADVEQPISVHFERNDPQALALSTLIVTGAVNIDIDTGAVVNMGLSVFSSSGTLTVRSGGTLFSSHRTDSTGTSHRRLWRRVQRQTSASTASKRNRRVPGAGIDETAHHREPGGVALAVQ